MTCVALRWLCQLYYCSRRFAPARFSLCSRRSLCPSVEPTLTQGYLSARGSVSKAHIRDWTDSAEYLLTQRYCKFKQTAASATSWCKPCNMLAPRETLWSSPDYAVDAALGMLKLTSGDHLVDYGCGDGVALFAAARKYGCRATGYEISEERAALVADRIGALPAELRSLLCIHAKNALDADPTEPTAVFLYLISRGLKQVLPMLQRAAGNRPEGYLRVVTVLYRIPGLEPLEQIKVVHPSRPEIMFPVYLFQVRPTSSTD